MEEDARIQEGFKRIREGRPEEALNSFKEALRINPGNLKALFGLGCAYAALGQRDEAIRNWRRCLELDPGMGEAHYALAWAYYDAGEYTEAYRHVEGAHSSGIHLESLRSLTSHFVKTGEPIREHPEEAERVERGMPLLPLGSLIFAISLTLFVAYYIGAIEGFPKGVDAYCHLTKIRYMVRYWPNFQWNYQWDCGVPLFAGSYPPLTYYLASGLVMLTGCSPELSLKLLSIVSFCVNSVFLLLFIHRATDSWLSGMVGVSLMVLTPAYWAWWIGGGNYARIIAMGFLGLSLYLASYESLRAWIALILTLAIAVGGHLVIGAGALLAVSSYILASRGFREGIKKILSLFIFVAGLDSFYITQFIFTNPTATGILRGSPPCRPTPLTYLLFSKSIDTLNIILLPSLIIFSIIALLLRPPFDGRIKASLTSSITIASIFLLYSTIGYLPGYPKDLYISGFTPPAALCMVSIGMSLSVAILAEILFRNLKNKNLLFSAMLILILLLSFNLYLPIIRDGVADETRSDSDEMVTQGLIKVDGEDVWHRVGTDSANVAIWFNYLYDTPQSRGYYAQGVPNIDWRAWFEYAVWFEDGNYPETNFLLDWHAVRWIIVGHPHFNYGKFLSKPEYYRPVGHIGDWWEFEYLNSSRILEAVNTPSILFIGSRHHYDIFIRVLSLSGLRSGDYIPVLGPSRYVDSYTLEELRRFPIIILYGYDYRDMEDMARLLSAYVYRGGTLFLEANGSPDYEAIHLPDPFPVRNTYGYMVTDEWRFNVSDHPISRDVNFTAFSPPLYGAGGWGVSTSIEMADWARPILMSGGSPLIVAGRYGGGRVVWSGMNLFYHAKSYRNGEEARFISRILEWLRGADGGDAPRHEVEFINPQRRIVKLGERAEGILFKESYFKQWHASLERNGGRERLRIYLAGPGFIYIPLPGDVEAGDRVLLWYEPLTMEKLGYLMSLTSLLALIIIAWRRTEWLM